MAAFHIGGEKPVQILLSIKVAWLKGEGGRKHYKSFNQKRGEGGGPLVPKNHAEAKVSAKKVDMSDGEKVSLFMRKKRGETRPLGTDRRLLPKGS